MRPTTPREQRLIAIGLLVLAIALAWLAVVSPILDGFAERTERRERLLLEYQHNARSIAAIPRLRRQAERQGDSLSRFVLAAPDIAAARQLLRERIERVVTEAGGEFLAGEDADAPAGWVAIRAGGRMTRDQLARSLARLQDEPPWLVISALDVSADQALVNGRLNPMEVSLEAQVPTRPALQSASGASQRR
jgi:hypothetical protein